MAVPQNTSGEKMKETFLCLDVESSFFGLYEKLRSIVANDSRVYHSKNEFIRTNPHWVRDHIHEMKGYIYWQKEIRSFLDLILKNQNNKGFFYEIFAPFNSPIAGHLNFVGGDCRVLFPDLGYGLVRLEVEADIEYLIVEGVHRIWQATGDTKWLEKNLNHLEKGIKYCLSDPKRWDNKYKLMKRPRTIDTWDFINRPDTGINRRILPDDPMGIMHGDNSGLYAAMIQLSKMFEICGQERKSSFWKERAEELRGRANITLWNGKFYIHHLPLDNAFYGVDEREQLSLSNAYDINRGLPTHKMAVSILDEYQKLRDLLKGEYFAEWFSLYPPYPQFYTYSAGSYINGGIASFVAGELAHAAFQHGREEYAVDILKRIAKKINEDGTLYFLYTKDGKNQGGGPSGWGAASLIYALIEGLAGIDDQKCSYEKVKISPRWVSADEKYAHIKIVYGPSDNTLEYDFRWDKEAKIIYLKLYPGPKEVEWNILLPPNYSLEKVERNKKIIPFKLANVEKSKYTVIKNNVVPAKGEFLTLFLQETL